MSRHSQALANALGVLNEPRFKEYIDAIYLYGSCARNEYKYSSDVDLFVRVKKDTPNKILMAMRSEVVSSDIALPDVELKFGNSEIFSSSAQFNENIEREGILLWERT